MNDINSTIDKKLIPLDKSWIIRMGILDLVNKRDDILRFLSAQQNLGDDLLALQRVATTWSSDELIDVGESGTLYRLLKFASWKLNLNKNFKTQGTLTHRKITDDPSIVNLPQSELLKLDNGTSQWASAAVLLGDVERLANPPFKLKLTYEAVKHWQQQRAKNLMWMSRYDETILNQAITYQKIFNGMKPKFTPAQAEDFCFAYTFEYMTTEEGEERWPALRGHESDRIVEIKESLSAAKRGDKIISKDHRVVQAIAMWGKLQGKSLQVLYPSVVNKSWPQFWDFLNS